ncbi:MAG: hypothetical protein HYU88_11485 [Chloroflexi bacterium]|nr:hypothetical protein [Chloroflexota bacterium]
MPEEQIKTLSQAEVLAQIRAALAARDVPPLAELAEEHPGIMAAALLALTPAETRHLVALIGDDRAATVVEELDAADAADVLARLTRADAADVLEEMAPDDATDVVEVLPPAEAEALLIEMEPADGLRHRRGGPPARRPRPAQPAARTTGHARRRPRRPRRGAHPRRRRPGRGCADAAGVPLPGHPGRRRREPPAGHHHRRRRRRRGRGGDDRGHRAPRRLAAARRAVSPGQRARPRAQARRLAALPVRGLGVHGERAALLRGRAPGRRRAGLFHPYAHRHGRQRRLAGDDYADTRPGAGRCGPRRRAGGAL